GGSGKVRTHRVLAQVWGRCPSDSRRSRSRWASTRLRWRAAYTRRARLTASTSVLAPEYRMVSCRASSSMPVRVGSTVHSSGRTKATVEHPHRLAYQECCAHYVPVRLSVTDPSFSHFFEHSPTTLAGRRAGGIDVRDFAPGPARRAHDRTRCASGTTLRRPDLCVETTDAQTEPQPPRSEHQAPHACPHSGTE